MILLSSIRCATNKRSWLLQFSRLASSGTTCDPLRVLFCGSDDFSIASLRALNVEKLADSSANVKSIDVVCRPGKRTGRGLKHVRNVPIHQAAKELELPVHEIDTFTGWQPPAGINLIVAVSFGLFVPPRILGGAKYGGLNIHPSMLPDLRGAAPIHHSLLLQRTHTGVTLQTLHPSRFDHGTILAQTPFPGIKVPEDATPSSMIKFLASKGAELLVRGLKNKVFIPPLQSVELPLHQIMELTDGKGIAHAPKITPEDRRIDWGRMSSTEILIRDRLLGNLWDNETYERSIHYHEKLSGKPHRDKPEESAVKRIVFSGGFRNFHPAADTSQHATEIKSSPGTPWLISGKDGALEAFAITALGSGSGLDTLQVNSFTIEGGKKNNGLAELKRVLSWTPESGNV